MRQDRVRDYIHQELNSESDSIAGHYVLNKECRLEVEGREVFYLVGCAVFDNSCCGSCKFGYALVPGFIMDWKYRKNEEGLEVSRVEPIRNQGEKDNVLRLIREKEGVGQINFA